MSFLSAHGSNWTGLETGAPDMDGSGSDAEVGLLFMWGHVSALIWGFYFVLGLLIVQGWVYFSCAVLVYGGNGFFLAYIGFIHDPLFHVGNTSLSYLPHRL